MDSNAISVGYAIQSGTVLQKCGNHWCRIGTSQVVNSSLVNNTATNVVSLVETYNYNNCSSWITQNRGENKGANSCAVAGNGLMYDNCERGTTSISSGSSYCISKGMRLPRASDTRAWNANGVPSCASFTWNTKDADIDGIVWNGTSFGHSSVMGSNYVRCVR